jgi:hypothetical protein
MVTNGTNADGSKRFCYADNKVNKRDSRKTRNEKFMSRITRRSRVMMDGLGSTGGRAWTPKDRKGTDLQDRIMAVIGLLHKAGHKRVHLDATDGARSKTRIGGYAKHSMKIKRLNGVHGTLVQQARKEGLL